MKTGRKILLAVLAAIFAAGLAYIADWLWLGSTVRGEVMRAFDGRSAGIEPASDLYFAETDSNLRLGVPGAFHDFRQAVVVLKFSYDTDAVVFDGEEYAGEAEYGAEGGEAIVEGDGEAIVEGDGEAIVEEDGEAVVEGNGEYADVSADAPDGGAETYTTGRVTTNVLVTAWLEFTGWRWQVVDMYVLYE